MTKLTDTQAVILSAASQRPGQRVLPLPERLRGGAAQKVVAGLIARGLAAEAEAGRDDPVWREAEDGPVTLIATRAALSALGIEPEGADAPEADAAPVTATEGATEAPDAGAAAEDAGPDEDAPAGDTVAEARNRKERKGRAGTKQAKLIGMLRAPEGATIDEIVAATGWQPHTVRGAIAGALKKRLGLTVTSDRVDGRGRVYRITG